MPSLTAGSTPEVKEGQQRDIQRPILCRVQKVSHINDSFLLGKVANGSRLIYGQKDGQTDRNLSRVLRSRKERPMFLHLRRPPIYSGQSIDDSLNTRTREELDVKERAEDGEVDKENVEAWELEDDESDYNDSGYYTDIDGSTAGTHQDLFSGVSGDSATSACN
ncbi:hypothetical protein FOXG_07082 [Fusarium oxysporum f. sp. lycopersici 4287]|uniref:Uncharacterized protein n=1 Tax=Fusarium oxysporum f. sp. lycopersici (strain 4287 / CBS 123668 / FGSC 9935 / NRRL 34936) TaxID=426428 RepID=A0A0J9V4A0_FUSO4|nr:hypothetical protein FOXG_07082 [Fusarium oxysporum f. sp. lycopersici 4287]KNB06329.1 hypothetical protein FOXG_07082 [Fusarium oxysporum f. sp. lycopersici 4287]